MLENEKDSFELDETSLSDTKTQKESDSLRDIVEKAMQPRTASCMVRECKSVINSSAFLHSTLHSGLQLHAHLVGDGLSLSTLNKSQVRLDVHGLLEIDKEPSLDHFCALCKPDAWIFMGSQYQYELTEAYAAHDGCIPSSLVLKLPKFIVPWRFRNKITGKTSWKVFHLSKQFIRGPENEIIVVNPYKDRKLWAAIDFVVKRCSSLPSMNAVEKVGLLLKVVRETLGTYGMTGGPSATEADAKLLARMKHQGHNLVFLCQVDIGVCRHKALLFKILADAVGLACALVSGYSSAGKHQWNIVTIPDKGDFLIDPTSRHFSWTKPGSSRTKGYKININESLGHAGFTLKQNGLI